MDNFCKHCGAAHTAEQAPQHCRVCNTITWFNPTPVAVLLQPVVDGSRRGILIGERGIQPQKGKFGLPGGFVDLADATMEAAAVRELFEETGFTVDLEHVYLDHSYGDGRVILTFCVNTVALDISVLDTFVKNHECPSVRVAWEPEELCFGSHTEALRKWFEAYGVDAEADAFVPYA